MAEWLKTLDLGKDTLDAFLQPYAEPTGLKLDQFKYIICLLAAYPLGLIHRSFPNSPTIKHLFSGLIGFAMGYACFGSGMIHSILTSLVTYIIVLTVKGSLAPKLVFLFTLAHLSISHIYRMLEDYRGYELDYTGPQMILIMKLTSFAYNVYDGTRVKKGENLENEEFKARAVTKMPSPLEYFSYVYFFGGFLAGPAVEIREYLEFTDMTLFPKSVIPPSVFPALRVFFISWICLGGTFVKDKYPVFFVVETAFYENTSYLYRFLYVQLSVTLHRFQYYFIWSLAEGACILAGLGFSGMNTKGEPTWDRCSNVDIIALETSQNFKSITDSWNKKTNNWLKYYIYLRLTPPNGKPTNFVTFATYLTSAFWHGFYPGYYVTFFTGAMMTTLARSLRQKIRPMFMKDEKNGKPTKIIYDFLSWVATFSSLNYICASFVLLDGALVWKLYISLYFIVHVLGLVLYVLVSFIKAPKKPDAQKPKTS